MKNNITMKDIARELNVSVVTVSKALNGKDGVSNELKKKIIECAGKKGYRLNTLAKSMKEGYSYNIGIVVSERFVSKPYEFYHVFYQYVTQVLGEYGYSVIIQVLSLLDEENLVLPRAYNEKKIDGLIVLGQISISYAQLLQKTDIPIMLLDFYDERIDIDSVVSDNFYGSYKITSYLIRNGHKDIAFIGDIYATSSIQDRFLGYYKALLENRIGMSEEYIISDRDKNGKYIDFQLPKKRPTAYVCNNDEVAYNLILKLKEQGIGVPDDCSVVGFDNSIHSTLSVPRITTMVVDIEEMAKTVSKCIINKIKKENVSYGRVAVKENIIIRDSVKNIGRAGN